MCKEQCGRLWRKLQFHNLLRFVCLQSSGQSDNLSSWHFRYVIVESTKYRSLKIVANHLRRFLLYKIKKLLKAMKHEVYERQERESTNLGGNPGEKTEYDGRVWLASPCKIVSFLIRFSQWPEETGWNLYYATIGNDFDKIEKEEFSYAWYICGSLFIERK